MRSDGKGQGLGEGSGPIPDADPARKPDPGPHHTICMAAAAAAAVEEEAIVTSAPAKKGYLPRSDSYGEECRICQQPAEEPLIVLGCGCRGELAKAHQTCADIWFRTRGSNKCEICQQVAANVSTPDSQPSTNYAVWRVDSTYGGTIVGRVNHERCFSPLWVAFAILIGGLLLDVLISLSLGVSALPVNIIIGVLIVLGLGTSFRLVLQCCHLWGSRRSVETVEVNTSHGVHPAA